MKMFGYSDELWNKIECLRAERDSLAAENRAMRATCEYMAEFEPHCCEDCPCDDFRRRSAEALLFHHTAREVERVKALKAVVDAARKRHPHQTANNSECPSASEFVDWDCWCNEEEWESALAALDKLAKGGE